MNEITSQLDSIQKQLSETALRHSVISENLANVNTPGYQAKEVVSFSSAMEGAMASKSDDASSLSIREKEQSSDRIDGNNVDIDKEMGELKKNSLIHRAYTQVLASKIHQMRDAISGR